MLLIHKRYFINEYIKLLLLTQYKKIYNIEND